MTSLQRPDWTQLARAVHAAPLQVAMAVTGGGSMAQESLLTVPGASRTVLEGLVPYSPAALTDLLGAPPEQYCSSGTARSMAMACYLRAVRFAAPGDGQLPRLAGIACTASLASDRPKRGAHRLHIAAQTDSVTIARSVELQRGRRDRGAEEELAAALILNLVAELSGVRERIETKLENDEPLVSEQIEAPRHWQQLLSGERNTALADTTVGQAPACQEVPNANPSPTLIFPGSFNPRHEGHCRMARIAEARQGQRVVHELSILNVDKPPLDFLTLRERTAQFSADERLLLTRAATFVAKARLLPGCTFVVGADTLRRVADARYYGGSKPGRDAAIDEIAQLGCHFLVFGRAAEDEKFVTLDELQLPVPLRRLCEAVSEDEFRADISSTALRRDRPSEPRM